MTTKESSETYEPAGLRDIVESLTFYMPNWQARLLTRYDEDGSGGLTFLITSCTPDSYDPNKTAYVNHPFLVPPASYLPHVWKAWIFECYMKVWRHEIGEGLLFDGVREFGPHHANGEDPYITWHIGDFHDTRVKFGHTKAEYLDTVYVDGSDNA